MAKLTLSQLAELTGGELVGNPAEQVTTVAPMDRATTGEVTFLSNPKYAKHLASCNATLVMLKEAQRDAFSGNRLVVADPYVAFAKVAQAFDTTPQPANGIHGSAQIAEDVHLGSNVSIGANAVIESGVTLGDDVVIGAGCFVGKNAKIGSSSRLWANVAVYHDVVIGEHCLVQSNTTIGSDGFGYANEAGQWIKIPQLGSVRIGNRVEIGANTSIDRGALDDTIIEDNVILDNQIQIAHNVVIGSGTAIAGATNIAGSTTIGKYCIIGGACGINGHITIADGVTITGMAMVAQSIEQKGIYSSGLPLQTNRDWRKTALRVHRIDEMNKRLKHVESFVDKLNKDQE